MKSLSLFLRGSTFFLSLMTLTVITRGQVFEAPFDTSYALTHLGQAPGVPSQYGGITFKSDDPNTLLLGGQANTAGGTIYALKVNRDTNNHIIGFTGTASLFANAPGLPGTGSGIDGGLAYGPSNILFYTSFNDNVISQIKPGETNPSVQIPLADLGIGAAGNFDSVGSLGFVPAGFAGQGRLKIASFGNDTWYDTTVSASSNGLFKINASTKSVVLPNSGPEGLIYVAAGNPGFDVDSVLISAYPLNEISAYAIDENGDPIPGTYRPFLTGLFGAEGAAVDPLTGDFLFSNFGGSDDVVVVKGFTVNPNDLRPIVKITAPADHATFPPGTNITIRADASDPDGKVVSVEFFQGTTSVGTVTNAPYQFVLSSLPAGEYILTARATDTNGGRTISSPVTITVKSATAAPTAVLVGLTNNATFKACSDLELLATGADSDGQVVKMEYYYAGTIKIGEALTAPYRLVWTNLPVGSFAVTAQAIDNGGARGTSAPVNITVTGLAPNVINSSVLTDKSFMICLGTETGASYQIQASTNLITWSSLATTPAGTNLTIRYIDSDASKFRYRFYRAQKL